MMKTSFPPAAVWCLLLVVSSATAVSCSRGPAENEASFQVNPPASVAVGANAPLSERSWEAAYNKGLELKNQGKPVEASYYFSNALGASPGNLGVIEAYCDTMLGLIASAEASEDTADDLSVLQVLDGFLQGQVPQVRYEDVGKVLSMLDGIRERMKERQAPLGETRDEYETLLESIGSDAYALPETAEELVVASRTLADLKEYAVERERGGSESEILKKIDALATRAQGELDFLALSGLLKAQRDAVLESCKTSAMIAEYKLQECEQTLRQMVAIHSTVHATHIVQELNSLKDLARVVAEAKSDENWTSSLSQLDSIKAKRAEILAPTEAGGVGVYQQKLENLEQEASLLQNALPGLVGRSLETAVSRMNSLKEEAASLNRDQSRAYNAWAMDRIRACLNKGGEGVGWFANGAEGRRTIGGALIVEMGPIDRRYLTAEVSRCFDEVLGKYLAPNQLNPVKDGSDLSQEGTILFTLNRMHESTKKQLSEF